MIGVSARSISTMCAAVAFEAATFFIAPSASADVLLNNWTGPCNADGSCTYFGSNNPGSEINPQQGSYILNNTPGFGTSFQAEAVSFNSGSDVTLTNFIAYMYNSGNLSSKIDFELMSNAGGVPSGTVLDTISTTVGGPPPNNHTADPLALTVNWSLTPSTTYWLVGVAEAGGFFVWNSSPYTAGAAYESGSASAAWTAGGGQAAVTINGSQQPVITPEPASLTLFGVGCAALGFVRRRRASRD